MATNPDIQILIVEDSPTQLAQLQHVLKGQGYDVLAASNGAEAFEILQTQLPTLVISDVMMPKMTGHELCRQIRAEEKLKELPVILLTSLSDPKDAITGLQSGADTFIVKPYEESTLLGRVEEILAAQARGEQDARSTGIEILFAGQKHLTCSDLITPELIRQAKILVVDDELSNVRLLEKILTRGGYKNLSMATDPRRVVSMFVDDEPNLLLLDLHMPHLDGHEVLALLRKIMAEDTFVPIIVLTADVSANAKHRALAAGVTDFVTKPFDATEVLLRIHNTLHLHFLYRQLQNQKAILEERVADRTRLLQESVKQLRRQGEFTAQPIPHAD